MCSCIMYVKTSSAKPIHAGRKSIDISIQHHIIILNCTCPPAIYHHLLPYDKGFTLKGASRREHVH